MMSSTGKNPNDLLHPQLWNDEKYKYKIFEFHFLELLQHCKDLALAAIYVYSAICS